MLHVESPEEGIGSSPHGAECAPHQSQAACGIPRCGSERTHLALDVVLYQFHDMMA